MSKIHRDNNTVNWSNLHKKNYIECLNPNIQVSGFDAAGDIVKAIQSKLESQASKKDLKDFMREQTASETVDPKARPVIHRHDLLAQLQDKYGFTAVKARQAILLLIVSNYCEMELGACIVSNDRLIARLQEFCIEINATTLKADLKALENEGSIKRKEKRIDINKTFRSILTFPSTQARKIINICRSLLGLMRPERYYANTYEQRPKSKDDVITFFAEKLKKSASEAVRFWEYYSKRGFTTGKKAIFDWKAVASKVWKSFQEEPKEQLREIKRTEVKPYCFDDSASSEPQELKLTESQSALHEQRLLRIKELTRIKV